MANTKTIVTKNIYTDFGQEAENAVNKFEEIHRLQQAYIVDVDFDYNFKLGLKWWGKKGFGAPKAVAVTADVAYKNKLTRRVTIDADGNFDETKLVAILAEFRTAILDQKAEDVATAEQYERRDKATEIFKADNGLAFGNESDDNIYFSFNENSDTVSNISATIGKLYVYAHADEVEQVKELKARFEALKVEASLLGTFRPIEGLLDDEPTVLKAS